MSKTTAPHVVEPVDLVALVAQERGPVPLFAQEAGDLHINVLRFDPGTGVEEHVNADLDVLLVGIAGEGVVRIDGMERVLRAGLALVIPKGAARSITAGETGLSYLSCHRRRAMLWPGDGWKPPAAKAQPL